MTQIVAEQPINVLPDRTDIDKFKDISRNGLWKNNVALVQLLGLCPLLAVSATVVNGLGLGIATLITLVLSNSCVSAIRHLLKAEIRIPIFVLIIASIVTVIELVMNAWLHDLYLILGIFIPLIVTNCSIIARAESFASKNNVLDSALDGFMMGLGFTFVLVLLGAMREALGMGTLFTNADLMFGEIGHSMEITLSDNYSGFLLAVLPPGAFIGLGLMIAAKNIIDSKLTSNAAEIKRQGASD